MGHSHNFIDLTGQVFNRLTVVRLFDRSKFRKIIWECKCECGNISYACSSDLKSGKHKSCGCLNTEVVTTHKLSKSRFYTIYIDMRKRCLNPNNAAYKNYGGRGITVCDRWLESFENFRDDMYPSYLEHAKEFGEKNTTIDRIDNNGNYCKENCTWATYKEQRSNQRDSITQKWFKAVSPTGNIYISNNQCEFGRLHNLRRSEIGNCLRDAKRNHHRWWTFKYLNDEEVINYFLEDILDRNFINVI